MTRLFWAKGVASRRMQSIAAAQFKAKCLAILDHVDPKGLLITKHGRVVAKLIPIYTNHASLIGALKGKIKKKGRLFSTGIKWHAQS